MVVHTHVESQRAASALRRGALRLVAVAACTLVAGHAAADVVMTSDGVVEVDAPRTTFAPPAKAWSAGGRGVSDFPGWAKATGYRGSKGARVGKRTVRGHRGAFEGAEARVFAERQCIEPETIPVWKRVADVVADVAVVIDQPVTIGDGIYSDYDIYTRRNKRHIDRVPAVDPDPRVGPVPVVGVELPKEFINRECAALDSHMIHFDPVGEGSVEGWVDFDRPIVAVLFYGNRLDGSDAVFGLPGVAYQGDFVDDRGRAGRDGMLDPVPWRGLELGVVAGAEGLEQVVLGRDADGRPNQRIAFTLHGDPAGDQIRVLTRAPCDCR